MKNQVYSWRLTPRLKGRLEQAARERDQSVAELLTDVTVAWLDRERDGDGELKREARIREKAKRFIGSVCGGDPGRSERVREEIRARLKSRRSS